jgi:hypothetical protein
LNKLFSPVEVTCKNIFLELRVGVLPHVLQCLSSKCEALPSKLSMAKKEEEEEEESAKH